MSQAAERAGVATTLARVGSMMTLFFSDQPVTDWTIAAQCDTKRFATYFWQMMDRGCYLPCSQYEAMFISAAHDEQIIDDTVEALEASLVAVARQGLKATP